MVPKLLGGRQNEGRGRGTGKEGWMQFDADKVRANAHRASTEDLLDRVTVYRQGMEPDALPILERELRSRGVSVDQIEAHAARREQEVLLGPDGWALQCSF